MAKVSTSDYIDFYLFNRSSKIGEHNVKLDEGYCKKLIDSLKFLVHHDEYYVVEDLKELRNAWHFGLNEWLGYEHEKLELDFIDTIVHPFIREFYICYALAMFSIIDEYKGEIRKLKTRYIINLPIKKANGSYVLVKQVSTPLQMDDKYNITSYISTYTIAEGYKTNPLCPRIFHVEKRRKDIEDAFFKKAAEFIEIRPEFELEEIEFKILKGCYKLRNAKDRKNKLKEEIQNFSDKTINNKSGSINQKMRGFLKLEEFEEGSQEKKCLDINNDVYSYALFLGKSGLLEVFEHYYAKKGFSKGKKN